MIHPAKQDGVTLIELIISIVIIGLALAGVLLALTTTTKYSSDPVVQNQAIAIAQAYLEEILSQDYLDPDDSQVCPSAEGSRSAYDNVCDYNGLDDNGARDQLGNALTGLSNYRVRVTVDSATANLNGLTGSANVLRVDVRVTFGSMVDMTVSAYKTNT